MPERRIDFLIIGGAKCATTWLQKSLCANHGVFMPAPELHYFSREHHRGRDWYNAQFSDAGPGDIVGEKSNSYLTEAHAAERIAASFPEVRLIVQMRDPVARAYSDYCMLIRRGEVSRDIRRHLDPDVAAAERFLDDGRYAHHLDRFLRLFPAEQILFLAYEDIAPQAERQLERAARHIGFRGELTPPLRERIKDREAPVIPRGLRLALSPFRPVLDSLRGFRSVRAVRDAVARPVAYPALPADIAAKMSEFYRDDIALLRTFAPQVVDRWIVNGQSRADAGSRIRGGDFRQPDKNQF
jgi:hypothetical protein